jgi:hypothetical protein
MTPPTLDQLHDETTWVEWRTRALTPLNVSDLVTTPQSRAEFLEGCRLLGVLSPKPHQLLINDMLAAGMETNGVLIPRQAGKTKTLTIIALGRCSLRARYNAAVTITTQATKTFEIFETTVIDELELIWPDEDTRPFKSYRGKGSQHVRFPNGSRFSAKSPKGSSFRASSYDLVWLDEGGEASPEQAVDLRAAIYSTFDTRPDAQLVVTGTAGTFRKGQLLFEALEDAGNGVVRYAFPEDVTADELAAWEPTPEAPYGRVRELTLAMHPGIASGLTTIEKVAKRFVALKERYAVEYGGLFGNAGEGQGAIDAQAWEAIRLDILPEVPEHFALGVMPSFTGRSASVVAAWRDADGKAHGYVLDHRAGTTWLAEAVASTARRHEVAVVYDVKSSDMRVEVETMQRMNPSPRLAPQRYEDVTSAAALLVKDVNRGHAVQYAQPMMDDAAADAVRRTTGPNAWALGRPPKKDQADISPLEAWALALRYYDDTPAVAFIEPIMAS